MIPPLFFNQSPISQLLSTTPFVRGRSETVKNTLITSTNFSPAKLPCVRLTVLVSEETESTEVQLKEEALPVAETIKQTEDDLEDTPATAIPAIDPLIAVKEHLLHLIDLARTEEWAAGLRSIMEPLVCTQSKKLKTVSEISVAEIAVQLALIEKKIPEELKMRLRQLSNQERCDFMRSDWWKNEAKERAGLPIDDQVWTDN